MLTDDEREELLKLGVRPTSTAIPVSRNIVALKAVIPFTLVLIVVMMLIAYVPALSMLPVSWFGP